MTLLEDLRHKLHSFRAEIALSVEGKVKIIEHGKDAVPSELFAEARRVKPALVVDLLQEKAWALRNFIDGDAPLADRLSRAAAYQDTVDRLAKAQGRLFDSWRAAGFTVVWSRLVEEFLLVGDGEPPPGSEAMAVYAWEEAKALEGADPESVRQAHRAKRAFGGKVESRRERNRA